MRRRWPWATNRWCWHACGTHRNLGNSSTRWRCPCNNALSKSSEVLWDFCLAKAWNLWRFMATKHGVAAHLVPKTEEGEGATICRQSHVDFLLGLQRADLRALHAQRKHCDQCHLLKPSEGKSEASYSPETVRVVDDGSVSPPRQCEATYCYSNNVDYWGAAVWVHPTPSVLTWPRTVGFSRLWSFEGSAEWNAIPRRRWGSDGGAWVAAHPSERIFFPRNLRACQALAWVYWTRRGLCWTIII